MLGISEPWGKALTVYRSYCYLPLYVFSGRHLLAAVLQPSDRDAAWRAGAVLKLLVDALSAEWPGVEVILRGDCGFCRPRILRCCEKAGVGYVVGLAYALLEGMRRMALSATDLARASPQTIRLTLLRVGAVVMSNT